jgi:hypothetical protein
MTEKFAQDKKKSNLERVLEANLRALIAADADKSLVQEYSVLLSCLTRFGLKGFEQGLQSKEKRAPRPDDKRHVPDDLSSMSLEELLTLVDDESVPRKSLERIASDRFGVPRGSMRSFSNRRMLVDKLRALIRNEQAHATIGNLARHNVQSRD